MAECVKCGYCCTKSVCFYGIWSKTKDQCDFLATNRMCSMYDIIIKDRDAQWNPAFGAGCSSSLFNIVREQKLKEVRLMAEKNLNICPHCKTDKFLADDFFTDMVKYNLTEGHIPCTFCGNFVYIRITKDGVLSFIEKYKLTTDEFAKLDF